MPAELRQACVAVFEARAEEARQSGTPVLLWPPTAVAHPHWRTGFASAYGKGGFALELDDAIAELSAWIAQIDAADSAPAA